MQGWESDPRLKIADRHPCVEEIKQRLVALDWHQLDVVLEANQVQRWKNTALQAVLWLMESDKDRALYLVTKYDMLDALREATPTVQITVDS